MYFAFRTPVPRPVPFAAVARRPQAAQTGPACDLVRTGDDSYRLSLEVPGFAGNELDLTVEDRTLTVRGRESSAGRPDFERRFTLAEHVEVEDARLENGLLHLDLVRRLPEALKPRRIDINTAHAS